MFDISLKTGIRGLIRASWVVWVRKKFEFLAISLTKLVLFGRFLVISFTFFDIC